MIGVQTKLRVIKVIAGVDFVVAGLAVNVRMTCDRFDIDLVVAWAGVEGR